MPIPWVAIGALSSAGSFAYTVFKSDASNQEILEYLMKLEIKIDEIIATQSAIIESINKLPFMLSRIVHSALVDQNYSYIHSHFSAYIGLGSESDRNAYITKNYERIRELFEYVVDFENRADGQIKLMSASEKMYVMMMNSETGIFLMKNTFVRKIDEIKDFVEDIEQSLLNKDNDFKNRLLKHRYIKSHNYTPPMKLEKFSISWQDTWVRDCIKPDEPDFLYQSDAGIKSTWHCPSPNRTIEGAEFKNRFNRIRTKVNNAITNSIEESKAHETHRDLIDKVYRPYISKLESHLAEYKKMGLFN